MKEHHLVDIVLLQFNGAWYRSWLAYEFILLPQMKYDPFQGRKQQKIMVLKKEIVNKTTYWDLACMNNKFRDINNSCQWNQTCATCGPCIWPCTKTYLQFISNLLNISKPQKTPGDYISQLLGTGNDEFDLSPHTHTHSTTSFFSHAEHMQILKEVSYFLKPALQWKHRASAPCPCCASGPCQRRASSHQRETFSASDDWGRRTSQRQPPSS